MPIESHPETERVQADLLRRMSPGRRFALMSSLSRSVLSMAQRALRRARPDATEEELRLAFIELTYGPELAARVKKYLEDRHR